MQKILHPLVSMSFGLEVKDVLDVLLPNDALPELDSSFAGLEFRRMLQRYLHQVRPFIEGGLFLEGPRHQLSHAVEGKDVCDAEPSVIGCLHQRFEVGVSCEIGHGEVELQLPADLLQHFLLNVGEGSLY